MAVVDCYHAANPNTIEQQIEGGIIFGLTAALYGEINIKDTPEIAHQLFAMVNFIVDDRITRPKEIAALYGSLPAAAKAAIEERDKEK